MYYGAAPRCWPKFASVQNTFLDAKSMQNNSPKPLNTAQKADVLHTFGVHVQALIEAFVWPLLFNERALAG